MIIKSDKVFLLPFNSSVQMVMIGYSIYSYNGALAVLLLCNQPSFDEVFGVITVNLPSSPSYITFRQYIDVNHFPEIGEWLRDNKIAEPTGKQLKSGWVTYPEYEFNFGEIIMDQLIALE